MTRFALLGAGVAVAHVAQAKRHIPKMSSMRGFSARRHVLGQKVHNEQGEVVGKIEDLILANRAVSHAILSVGGFLGLATCRVAIPVADFIRKDDRIVLPGATKEAVRALPRFEYGQVSE
jgi:hypothetical protein